MPRIDCGLEQLDWTTVLRMIKYIFQNSKINIQIFSKNSVVEIDKQQITSEHHAVVWVDTVESNRQSSESKTILIGRS